MSNEIKVGDKVIAIRCLGPVNRGYEGEVVVIENGAVGVDWKREVPSFNNLEENLRTPTGYYVGLGDIRIKQNFKKGQLIVFS